MDKYWDSFMILAGIPRDPIGDFPLPMRGETFLSAGEIME